MLWPLCRQLCCLGASTPLSLGTAGKEAGILSESFSVPCRPACVPPVGDQAPRTCCSQGGLRGILGWWPTYHCSHLPFMGPELSCSFLELLHGGVAFPGMPFLCPPLVMNASCPLSAIESATCTPTMHPKLAWASRKQIALAWVVDRGILSSLCLSHASGLISFFFFFFF